MRIFLIKIISKKNYFVRKENLISAEIVHIGSTARLAPIDNLKPPKNIHSQFSVGPCAGESCLREIAFSCSVKMSKNLI